MLSVGTEATGGCESCQTVFFSLLWNWHGGVVSPRFYLWMEYSHSLKRSALNLHLNHYTKFSGCVIAIELAVKARDL